MRYVPYYNLVILTVLVLLSTPLFMGCLVWEPHPNPDNEGEYVNEGEGIIGGGEGETTGGEGETAEGEGEATEGEGETAEGEGGGGVALSAPGSLTVVPGADRIELSWDVVADVALEGYRVYRATSADAGGALSISSELLKGGAIVDGSVVTGVTYYYWISAVDGDGVESGWTGPASATAGLVEVLVKDHNGPAGDTVRISVSLSSAFGLLATGTEVVVRYPTDLLPSVSVERTAVTAEVGLFADTTSVVGQVTVTLSGTDTELSGGGNLFTLVGQIAGDADGCGEVVVTSAALFNTAGEPVEVLLSSAQLCVGTECMAGDVNEDGVVDDADVQAILDVAVLVAEATECSLQAGDFNGDGRLDSADAVMLSRKSSGLELSPGGAGADTLQSILTGVSSIEVGVPLESEAYPGETITVPVTISDPAGVAGLVLVNTFPPPSAHLTLDATDTGDVTTDFANSTNQDDGFIRMTMASDSAPSLKAGATVVANLTFTVGADAAVGTLLPIQMNAVQLHGEYGDAFDWYTQLVLESGNITVVAAPVFDNPEIEGEDLVSFIEELRALGCNAGTAGQSGHSGDVVLVLLMAVCVGLLATRGNHKRG
jgi:hypothetical protein